MCASSKEGNGLYEENVKSGETMAHLFLHLLCKQENQNPDAQNLCTCQVGVVASEAWDGSPQKAG